VLTPVTFEPSGAIVWVEPGTTVLAAARAAGVSMQASCDGRTRCGSCAVRVVSGALEPPSEHEAAALARGREDVRLGCRARVAGAVTVKPLVVEDRTVALPIHSADGTSFVAGVDLGTTTVSAAVVDPATGLELGRASVPNRQRSFGGDILSRLSAAVAGSGGDLQRLAEESVTEAVRDAAGSAASRVTDVVIAANTAMASLYSGADVSSLVAHPFTPPESCCRSREGSAVSALLARDARISVIDPIAGFVGGDLVAGVVAMGLMDAQAPQLLVDVGTNAEVAVVSRGGLWVASAAAGPAFEGGGVTCGGIAVPGAVSGVSLSESGELSIETISDAEPTWFSGAGLLSALALLVRSGHVDASGLLIEDGPLCDRIEWDSAGVLGVRFGECSGSLVLTQLDIRTLQLAKAAVRVAIEFVLMASGVIGSQVEAAHVSGAFGTALAERDLVDLGVVPRETVGKLSAAGNTALAGAIALATDPNAEDTVRAIVTRARHVDLASRAGFNEALMTAVRLEPFSA